MLGSDEVPDEVRVLPGACPAAGRPEVLVGRRPMAPTFGQRLVEGDRVGPGLLQGVDCPHGSAHLSPGGLDAVGIYRQISGSGEELVEPLTTGTGDERLAAHLMSHHPGNAFSSPSTPITGGEPDRSASPSSSPMRVLAIG
jgi:hypothetical protein